jgi:hypothetical protein
MNREPGVVPSQEQRSEDPLAAAQAILRNYPQARSEATGTEVTVYPVDASGFEVTLRSAGSLYEVCCGGWRQVVPDSRAALDLFLKALSPACRLKVTLRGGHGWRWQLQVMTGAEWRPLEEIRLLVFPFGGGLDRDQIVYLQNRILEAA